MNTMKVFWAVVLGFVLTSAATRGRPAQEKGEEVRIKVNNQWAGRVPDREKLRSQIIRNTEEFEHIWRSTHAVTVSPPEITLDAQSMLFVIADVPQILDIKVVGNLHLTKKKVKGKLVGLSALFQIKVDSKSKDGRAFVFALLGYDLPAKNVIDIPIEKRPGRFRIEKMESGDTAYSIGRDGEVALSGVWIQTQGILLYETVSLNRYLSGRPVLVLEEMNNQESTFEPPFQYTGPYFSDVFKKSVVDLYPGISAGSADPKIGISICTSPCGAIVVGNAVIEKGGKKVRTADPAKLTASEIALLLKSPNPVKRATAIWALTRSDNKDNLGTLTESLKDTDPLVRLYTVYGIGVLGPGKSELIAKVQNAQNVVIVPEAAKVFFEPKLKAVLKETLDRLKSTKH